MISFECKNGRTKFEMQGSGVDITTDVMVLIHRVYEGFAETSEKTAEIFKKCITESIEVCFEPEKALLDKIDLLKCKPKDNEGLTAEEKKINEVIDSLKVVKTLLSELEELHNED